MNLRKNISLYYKNNKNNGIDNGLSSICHFSSSCSTLGYSKLFFWKKGGMASARFVLQVFKHFVSISRQSKYSLIKKTDKKNYKKLVLTWGYKKDFLKNGSLKDRYFNYNSKRNSKILWLVMYLDKKLPNKINDNIIILKNDNRKFNAVYLLKVLYKTLIKNRFNLRKSIHNLSSSSNLALILVAKVKNEINFKQIKSAITPFEGQPFQQFFFNYLGKNYKSLKTIGYLSHTHPLQYDIFFRSGSPKELLTHSPDQRKYIQAKLGWPKDRVKLVPSMRFFKKDNKNLMSNKIFFPYDFYSANKILLNFENYLISCKHKSLPNFTIKKHPAPYNLNKQYKLEAGIKKLVEKYKNRFNKKIIKNQSIVLGLSSSVPIALEKGIEIIHIVADKYFESFDKEIWPNIVTKELLPNVLFYKIKKYNKCIIFGKKKNNLEKNI